MHAINPSKRATDEPPIDESHGKGAASRLHDDPDAPLAATAVAIREPTFPANTSKRLALQRASLQPESRLARTLDYLTIMAKDEHGGPFNGAIRSIRFTAVHRSAARDKHRDNP